MISTFILTCTIALGSIVKAHNEWRITEVDLKDYESKDTYQLCIGHASGECYDLKEGGIPKAKITIERSVNHNSLTDIPSITKPPWCETNEMKVKILEEKSFDQERIIK